MNDGLPIDHFESLSALPMVRHGFTGRLPGLDVATDREEALGRLAASHADARARLHPGERRFVTCEQIHGRGVALVDETTASPVAGVDGLITATPGVTLGIYVADCCAIYLVDPERRAIGLLHSGRKGTELGIASAAIAAMQNELGCDPTRMIVQLSPCIRPPHFETDFAAQIVAQCRAAGVREVFDCGTCTATRIDRYYSYRLELGKTGRMLALLRLVP